MRIRTITCVRFIFSLLGAFGCVLDATVCVVFDGRLVERVEGQMRAGGAVERNK